VEKKKPEIIFAWNYHEWGGVQIYFLGIIREAIRRGYRIKAVMPAGSSRKLLGYFESENAAIEFFNARIDFSKAKNVWHKIRRRFRDWRCHFVLARHLSKQDLRQKIIQLDAGVWAAFWLIFYLSLKTHVFVTMHIATPFNRKSVNDWLTKIKYSVLCQSKNFHLLCSNEDMKQSLRPFLPEKYWREIPIAYTGVNTAEIKTALAARFDRAKLLEKFGLPTEDKLIALSVGNIIERKGWRVLLAAAEKLKDEKIFFVWFGDGDERELMQEEIIERSLQNSVKIVSKREAGETRAELLEFFRLADIFVHPSFAEGLPGAMLEAMALGKPAIVSNVNAIPECVTNGENGFLIEAGDSNNFAAAIQKLCHAPNLRQQFGKNGQTTVLQKFTEEQCGVITVDFYEKFYCLNSKERG
jgi:glycosyltransferase involved in cell wall biosynthesis